MADSKLEAIIEDYGNPDLLRAKINTYLNGLCALTKPILHDSTEYRYLVMNCLNSL